MAEPLAAARALKERCYAAWHSDPAQALHCAHQLRALADAAGDDAAGREIAALAAWTEAVADLVEGRLVCAVDRLDAAAAGFAELGLAGDAAQTQVPKVMALALLGRFADALACAERTRDALLALGDLRSAAKVVLNTGSLCMQQDRYAEAAAHYRRAAVLFARCSDREHSVLADVGRADALSYLGELAEAEALYRRAAQRAQRHGLPVVGSAVVQALAELALARGRFGDALQGLEAASREFARLGLPLQRLEAEKALADAYLELRLLPEADALYEQVLAALAAHEDSATRPWVWLQRARAAADRADLRAAEAALARAAPLFDAMDNEVGRAALRLAQAQRQRAAGDARAAQATAADALARLDALGLPSHGARLALAEAAADAGADAPAQRQFDALLADRDTPLPLRERAWSGRGGVLLRLGHRDDARQAFEQAVVLAEATRATLPGDDFQRAWLQQRHAAYEGLLRLALADHDDAPGEATAGAALQAAERLRARTLRDRLGPAAAAGDVDAADDAGQAMRLRLDWLARRLNRFLHEGDGSDAPAALHDERRRLEQALLERVRRSRIGAGAAVAATPAGAPANDAAALHAALGDASALIVYAALDDELLAFVAAGGRLQLERRVARSAQVRPLLRTLRGLFDSRRLGAARLQRHEAQLAERTRRCLGRLHELVWRPLAGRLAGCATVHVVAGGALAALPFAALWDGRRHVAQTHAVVLQTSADALLRPAPRPQPSAVAVFADTLRLPGAAAEADAVAARWPQALRVTGEAATRDALRRAARDAGVLHLACHGEFRADSPLFSALHLHDGALTAFETERLPLAGAPLVVLSACETALADDARGDESLGLVRAWLIAGARAVVGGLWAVDDAATAGWMAAFHAALAAGAAPAQALRAVQAAAIERGDDPWHWAAFTLYGGA